MSNEVSNPASSRPEWLAAQVQGKSEGEQKIWQSAYDKVHNENHFLKGEGPSQALSRLKEQGFLPDMKLDDLAKVAEQHRKAELGPKGSLHRDYYTTHDRVLSTATEKQEIAKLVESEKKNWQAHKLAPTTEDLNAALTPQVAHRLADAGLDADSRRLRDGIIQRMKDDKALSSADMEKMKSCPVGSPYVATGAVTSRQMDGIIAEQKHLRDTISRDGSFKDLKEWNPEEYKREWQNVLKQTDVSSLLRKHASEDPHHYNWQKIDAADSLIKSLQELHRQKN
ncbi:hypothetical protein BH10CYA1_BH10CYA1_21070 [soil metagenome]